MAPITKATATGTLSGGAFVGSARVSLSAIDSGSGVAARFYILDNGPIVTYTGPIPVTTLGTHTVKYFSKDVAGNTEPPHSISVVVKPAATATTVVSGKNPSNFAAAITFTASVTASAGPVPSGTVTFKDGTTAVGTVSLTHGQASLTTTALHAGTHTITATYTGGSSDSASTSAPVTEIVGRASTATSLAASTNPSTYGKSVTFTASVTSPSGSSVGGSVVFKDGTGTLGTASLNTTTHSAVFSTAALGTGNHAITATYSGSGDYNSSTSTSRTETVNKAATSTVLSSSLNPATHGTAIIFTAIVTPASGGAISGTVTFKTGTTTLGSGAVNSTSHKATFSISSVAVGTHPIVALYGGSNNLNGSTSATLNQVIK